MVHAGLGLGAPREIQQSLGSTGLGNRGSPWPKDAGVLTLLDVGLGLWADGDTPTVCLIVKCDLQGYSEMRWDRVNLGRPKALRPAGGMISPAPSLPHRPHTAPGPGSPSSRIKESCAPPPTPTPSWAGSSPTPQGPWAHQDTEGVAVWDFIVDQAPGG